VGGGLLGGLGRVFDYPRQALANLTYGPLTGLTPNPSAWSMLPGAMGLAAGIGAASNPLTLPFAPLIGSGVGGLAQAIGSAVSPDTFAAPSTGDVLEALGADRESTLGNLAVGVATDPMTLAGAFTGGMGGRAVSGALEGLQARNLGLAANAAKVAEAEQTVAHLRDLAQAAAEGHAAFEAIPPAAPGWMSNLREGLEYGPTSQYRPDVLGAFDVNLGGASKLYKNVDPQLAQHLEWMGAGAPEGPSGFRLAMDARPEFTRVAGAKLMPSFARAEALGGGTPLAMPGLVGPTDLASYEDVLMRQPGYVGGGESPGEIFSRLRGEAGLGELGGATPPQRTLAQVIGEERAGPLYEATRRTALVPGTRPGTARHVLDMPVGQAPYAAFQHYANAAQELGAAQAATTAPLTPLQALLARMGFG
jgi:hypothetical protein